PAIVPRLGIRIVLVTPIREIVLKFQRPLSFHHDIPDQYGSLCFPLTPCAVADIWSRPQDQVAQADLRAIYDVYRQFEIGRSCLEIFAPSDMGCVPMLLKTPSGIDKYRMYGKITPYRNIYAQTHI